MSENITISVNGEHFDDAYEDEVISSLLKIMMPSIKYMSPHAIRTNMQSIADMVDEIELSPKINKKTKLMRMSLDRTKDENLVSFFTEVLMSSEGLGTLRGFGLAQTESKGGKKRVVSTFNINPERTPFNHDK